MTGSSVADHHRRDALLIHLETAAVLVPKPKVRTVPRTATKPDNWTYCWVTWGRSAPTKRSCRGSADIEEDQLAARMDLVAGIWESVGANDRFRLA
ncbi:hypothetical protein [uncultured Thiodictyon sp.]|jgi:hypothetical protein|uniref:hypothetical protein n=1 Tax=uncultured Thiodictyon sp. TaxID=1846217 RepID=UPI0025FC7160|nr:hypothetical protein [uncultured Thiodictyon sp.]